MNNKKLCIQNGGYNKDAYVQVLLGELLCVFQWFAQNSKTFCHSGDCDGFPNCAFLFVVEIENVSGVFMGLSRISKYFALSCTRTVPGFWPEIPDLGMMKP